MATAGSRLDGRYPRKLVGLPGSRTRGVRTPFAEHRTVVLPGLSGARLVGAVTD
jgi:hypothetical protein